MHPNTPASISYSPGQHVSLSELRQGCRREDAVVLPHTVGIWRSAFRSYVTEEGLSQFISDLEAEREGEGPVLPPLRAANAALKRRVPQEAPPATEAAATTATAGGDGGKVEDASCSPGEKGIVVVSHHKLSGRRRFVYPDHDGVLSAGVVPRVVISEEEKAEQEANQKYYVSPSDLPEEERAALEELQTLWKSRAHSRSEQGARHRAAVGNIVFDENALGVEESHSSDARVRRRRLDPGTHNGTNAAEAPEPNTCDVLDDALRLAGELLDLI